MNEALRREGENIILTESKNEPEGAPVEEIISLFQENQSAITEIKIMLSGYFEKLKNANSHSNELMSSRQVQQCLRISKSTLRRYRKSGVLRVMSINNSYRYFSEEVKGMKEERMVNSE